MIALIEQFLVQIDVEKVTRAYAFKVLNGDYPAGMLLLSLALPTVPCELRISAVQLSNPDYEAVSVVYILP